MHRQKSHLHRILSLMSISQSYCITSTRPSTYYKAHLLVQSHLVAISTQNRNSPNFLYRLIQIYRLA